jgi:hypothetical protein
VVRFGALAFALPTEAVHFSFSNHVNLRYKPQRMCRRRTACDATNSEHSNLAPKGETLMISRRAWQLAMLTLFSGVLAYAPLARAQTNVTSHHVVCNSIVAGSIKFAPALTPSGTAPLTVKFKGKLSGCSDSDDATIKFIDGKSKFKGVLTGVSNNCVLLLGSPPLAGTITVTWKTDPTTLITPTQTTVTVPAGAVSTAIYSAFGSSFSSTHLGTPNTALTSTGAFGGGEAGVSSAHDIVSSEDFGASIFNACGGPKGLKKITIGIGVVTNG